jgi:hypothetical protein
VEAGSVYVCGAGSLVAAVFLSDALPQFINRHCNEAVHDDSGRDADHHVDESDPSIESTGKAGEQRQ